MGNCINHGAMLSWAAEEEEEEWEWADSSKSNKTKRSAVAAVVVEEEEEEEKERLVEGKARSVEAPASTEVKIKITKKQLEELLRNVDGVGLPVQQVLARLVSGDVDHAVAHWRPALQSIPETAES